MPRPSPTLYPSAETYPDTKAFLNETNWLGVRNATLTWLETRERWATWADIEVPLSARGQSTSTLALTAATRPPLQAADGRATTALALTAATRIPLASAAGTSSTALAPNAPTALALAAAGGGSTTALSLRAPALLGLSSAGLSTTSIALSIRIFIENRSWAALVRREPTWTATEAEWATWADLLKGPWPIYSDGIGQTSLALHAPALLALASAGGSSTALHLAVSALLNLHSDGAATTALRLQVATILVLHATGTSSTALAVGWPRLKVRQGGVWVRGRVTPPMKIKSPGSWLPV